MAEDKNNYGLGQLIFNGLLLLISVVFLIDSFRYPIRVRILPQACLVVMVISLLKIVYENIRALPKGAMKNFIVKREIIAIAWILGLMLSVMLVGLTATAVFFPIAYMRYAKASWPRMILMVVLLVGISYGLFVNILRIPLETGIIGRMLGIR